MMPYTQEEVEYLRDKLDQYTHDWATMGATLSIDASEQWASVAKGFSVETSGNPFHIDEYRKEAPRRHFVRAVFAFIEGMAFLQDDYVLFLDDFLVDATGCAPVFSDQERERIKNATDARGHFLKFAEHVRTSYKNMERLTHGNTPVHFAGAEWPQLCSAAKIRDRLTHPKRPEDLRVSDDDARQVRASFEWFVNNFVEVREAVAHYANATLRSI